MTLTVEWVYETYETPHNHIFSGRTGERILPIPVIRVATLRRWLAKAKQESENGLSPDAAFGYRQALNDLLAQLPED